MTSPIPTRFNDDELATIDQLVQDGVGKNRSDVIRRAVEQLDEAVRRARIGEAIRNSYSASPQTREDDQLAIANAVAMTEAEPW